MLPFAYRYIYPSCQANNGPRQIYAECKLVGQTQSNIQSNSPVMEPNTRFEEKQTDI